MRGGRVIETVDTVHDTPDGAYRYDDPDTGACVAADSPHVPYRFPTRSA